MKRVLVANRGEIALRIIRTLREMGIESVALFSDADAKSTHVRLADYAYHLPGVTSQETYLQIPKVIRAIQDSGADGVHPGYGFLSENAHFAEAIACETRAKFIGPSPKAIELMGDKVQARNLVQAAGVPVVPGVTHGLDSVEDLRGFIQAVGYPVILKAACGGGGRGMRVLRSDGDVAPAYEACRREALAYFGDDKIFCERYIDKPRHIEVQVLFDEHGHGVHLFERDCSIQRRHQKLFEEAPSAFLNHEQRMRLGELAVKVASAVNYAGAGTIEFICESPEKVYFMEMNTRIQVEHPVTEMITGVDLIREQIRVASGEPLGFGQKDISLKGWAMEARINAEDPKNDFAPGPGVVSRLRLPSGPFCRVDSHLYQGYEIPQYYDSMVAKLIVWAPDRNVARSRMLRALSEMELAGVPSTIGFHEALLGHPNFQNSTFDTGFLARESEYFQKTLQGVDHLTPELAMVGGLRATHGRRG